MVICLTETTLFYHLLRLTNAPVAHPTTKYGTGLIANWADNVILAANHIPRTPTPSRIGTSNTLSSSELVTNASASCTDSTRFAVYQPPGLELNNEDEILAFLDQDPDPSMGPPTYVSSLIHLIVSLIVTMPDTRET